MHGVMKSLIVSAPFISRGQENFILWIKSLTAWTPVCQHMVVAVV